MHSEANYVYTNRQELCIYSLSYMISCGSSWPNNKLEEDSSTPRELVCLAYARHCLVMLSLHQWNSTVTSSTLIS